MIWDNSRFFRPQSEPNSRKSSQSKTSGCVETRAEHSQSLCLSSFGEGAREFRSNLNSLDLKRSLVEGPLELAHNSNSGVALYALTGQELSFQPPARQLKVAFLTSIRDVGVEENVGGVVRDNGSASYVEGTIETALRAANDSRLGGYADIVAIITDDMSSDLKGTGYTANPTNSGQWILPRSIRNQRGELVTSLTTNIPSDFRAMPLRDAAGRHERKREFENKVSKVLLESGADVLISDHFMARIDFLISEEQFGLLGKVLNTHPGMTRREFSHTTIGKNPYELMRLHAQGFRRLPDDSIVKIRPYNRAGASFHFVTQGIDSGAVLCDGELTDISSKDSDRVIAQKMYRTSKYHVFIEGLRHYASNIFPFFDTVTLGGDVD